MTAETTITSVILLLTVTLFFLRMRRRLGRPSAVTADRQVVECGTAVSEVGCGLAYGHPCGEHSNDLPWAF